MLSIVFRGSAETSVTDGDCTEYDRQDGAIVLQFFGMFDSTVFINKDNSTVLDRLVLQYIKAWFVVRAAFRPLHRILLSMRLNPTGYAGYIWKVLLEVEEFF